MQAFSQDQTWRGPLNVSSPNFHFTDEETEALKIQSLYLSTNIRQLWKRPRAMFPCREAGESAETHCSHPSTAPTVLAQTFASSWKPHSIPLCPLWDSKARDSECTNLRPCQISDPAAQPMSCPKLPDILAHAHTVPSFSLFLLRASLPKQPLPHPQVLRPEPHKSSFFISNPKRKRGPKVGNRIAKETYFPFPYKSSPPGTVFPIIKYHQHRGPLETFQASFTALLDETEAQRRGVPCLRPHRVRMAGAGGGLLVAGCCSSRQVLPAWCVCACAAVCVRVCELTHVHMHLVPGTGNALRNFSIYRGREWGGGEKRLCLQTESKQFAYGG